MLNSVGADFCTQCAETHATDGGRTRRGPMIDFGESQFRIPKISVPINCLLMSDEKIAGEIFVDDLGSHEYTAQQLIDFFNDEPPFFPVRTSVGTKPILIQKCWVAQIEIIGMIKRFQEQAAPLVSQKRAIMYRPPLAPTEATIILDMPEDHSRLLDLLNVPSTFIPALVEGTYCVVNARQIFKIEEL
jgi:hypothetical protein